MHLSVKHSQAIEDEDLPQNPEQSPGDILFLSFTDSDLSCMAAVSEGSGDIRFTSLNTLKHNLSVDLYIEQVAEFARVIVVRLLGGHNKWKYGAEEFSRLARRKNIKLIMVSGCGSDLRLAELSTVSAEEITAVENCLAQGGAENFGRVIAYLRGGELPEAKIIENVSLYKEKQKSRSREVENYKDGNILHSLLNAHSSAAIIFYRAHYLALDTAPIDALCDALASKGMAFRAFAVTSLKDEEVVERLKGEFSGNEPDILIDATVFSAGSGSHPLAYLNVPILQVATANMSREAWRESARGLSTSDMAMQLVLPEADGRIFTRAISFKAEGEKYCESEYTRLLNKPENSRVEYVAELAAAWVNLRKKPNEQKKIALILSDYPQRDGRNGYAVGLDAFASAEVILEMLAQEGYEVAGHESRVMGHEKYSLKKYKENFEKIPAENRQAVLDVWGDVPAEDFEFDVRICGNVSVALQPDRGSLADKKTGYHDGLTPPCHRYLAFYFFLREEFGTDALIHLGTHGNLEWLPAKTAALSEKCWPEIVLGAVPVIYPYIVSDAGEAAQAKRRISAVIISHLTPPLVGVELSPDLCELERLTDEYGSADGLDGRRMKLLRDEIIFRAKHSGLSFAESDDAAVMSALEAHLCDVKEQRVGSGLHVFGSNRPHHSPLPEGEGIFGECAANERRNLLAALSGGFIPPSSGGAPSRGRVDILPTGRNLVGVDPRTIPTKTASLIGKRAAGEFVRRYVQDNGEYPQNVLMDIWGSATLRTGGDEIAQALALMGVELVWDETTQRVSGFEIIPDADMQWERVDVTLRISGLFRDMFPNLILLFDDAVQAVSSLREGAADEAINMNNNAWIDAPSARNDAKRKFRIFGNAPSAYGAGTTALIDSGNWQSRADLGAAYLESSGFAYGRGADGVLAASDLRERVKKSDALIHVQDLREVDVLSGADFADSEGGFSAAADMLGGAPDLYHIDTTNPDKIKARTLAEEISLVLHSRAINPQWIEGQMRHGYAGAAGIADVVDNLFAHAASGRVVSSEQFDIVADSYLHDDKVREFLARENPEALAAIIARLNEAIERRLWNPRRNSIMELLG